MFGSGNPCDPAKELEGVWDAPDPVLQHCLSLNYIFIALSKDSCSLVGAIVRLKGVIYEHRHIYLDTNKFFFRV